MGTYAVIMANKVVNLIVAESKEAAEELTLTLCVEAEGAFLGDDYDTETGAFVTPAPAEVAEGVEEMAQGATMTPEEAEALIAAGSVEESAIPKKK